MKHRLRLKSEQGLSLVEVILATALLVVTLSPMVGLFFVSRYNAEDALRRAEALAAARAIIDEMVARSTLATWDDIEAPAVNPFPYPPDPRYTIEVTVDPRTEPDPSAPGGIKTIDYLKDVTVRVEWREVREARSVELYSAVYKRED